MLDDREVGEETRANRRRVQLTLVLLAVGCATGGGTATPSLRVDHGKLAARMGIVQKLSEPAEPVPAEPVDRHERSTEGLGGAVPTNTRAPEGRLRGLGGALPSPGEPAGAGVHHPDAPCLAGSCPVPTLTMSSHPPLRGAVFTLFAFGLNLGGCLPQGMDLSSPQGVMASGNRVTSRSLLPAGKRKRFEITCDYPGSCKNKAKESCSGPYEVEEDSTEDAAYQQTDEDADADTQAQENAKAIEEAHAHDGTSAPKHRLVVKCK